MADPTTWTPVGAPTSNTSVTIPSLTPGASYDLEVTATNSVGSATSTPITGSTASGAAPSAVTGLSASQIGISSVLLSWSASASGTAPISYQPQLRVTGQAAWANFGSALSGTSETITGLFSSTSYDFQVVAINAIGTSTSSVVVATTLPSTTVAVAPSAPTNLITSPSSTSIGVTWSASSTGTAPISYQLQYRLTGQTIWANAGAAGFSLSGSITNLTSGSMYDVQVVASNSAGTIASATVTASTTAAGVAPSAPFNVGLTAITPNSVTLSWSASSGTAPISYQAQYRPTGTTAWTSVSPTVTGSPATVPGLAGGSTYDFRVVASNAAGTAASNTVTASTSVAPTAPAAPGAPVAWIIMPTSISLVWAASASGTAPINYQVQMRPHGSGSWLLVNTPSTATSTTVEGLTAGTNYDFQVLATNTAGSTPSSILSVFSPVTGTPVSVATFRPNQLLSAADLDAALDAKMDAAGGPIGPISITETGTGGSQVPAIKLSRPSGGVSDQALVSGSYVLVVMDGPVVPYGSISMSLTLNGDASGNGPAGNVRNISSSLQISALRSTTAPASGSQHSALSGLVDKYAPTGGIPSGRRLSDGHGAYASVNDHTNLPSSQSGGLGGSSSSMTFNGADDAGLRYGTKLVYGEATPVSGGGYPAEIARGAYIGSNSTTTYAKVILDLGSNFSVAGLDLRSSSAFQGIITSVSPTAPVTVLTVDRALMFTSAGSPAAAVTASNPKAVRINGNSYSVVSVSLTAGTSSGVLNFSSPVSVADAKQGNAVVPVVHTIWLSEGSGNALPGDVAFNSAGTASVYYDPAGGGLTVGAGSDRISLRSTAAVRVPVGTSGQRPTVASFGDIRANADTGLYEGWQPSTSSWVPLSGGSGTATSGGTAPGPAGAVTTGTPTSSAVSVSWVAPATGTAPFTYQVQYRISGVAGWTDWGGQQSSTSSTISGLTAATRYDFQIVTYNAYGTSTSPSASATTASIAPSAPTNLAVGTLTSTTAALTWTASAVGTAPISYQVQYRVSGAAAWTSAGSLTSGTSYTVTGLTAATLYNFQVVASNNGGQAISTAVNATTTTAATAAPSAPTGVTALSPTSSGLVVSWSAPATGTAPFSYQVFYRATGSTTWIAFGGVVTALTEAVTGLAAATSYDFEVTATNSAGSSTSSVVTGVTAAAPVASSGSVTGSQTTGTSNPVITGPTSGSVPTSNVLSISSVTISDPTAATATGSCTLAMSCTSGTLSSAVGSSPVTGSGTNTIRYVNTLSACQTAAADLTYTAGSAAGSDNIVVAFTDQAGSSHSITIAISVTAPVVAPSGSTPVPIGIFAGNVGDPASGSYPGFDAQWDGFVSAMGRAPTLIDCYMDQTYAPSDATFGWALQPPYISGKLKGDTRTANVIPVFGWSFGYISGGTITNLFSQISSGSLDTVIQNTLGAWKTGGFSTLYIRPAWEFNLNNNYAVTSANLASFISAWQHFYTVVHSYASANGMQIKIVWNPNVGQNQNSPALTVAQQYPGDAYVDVYGIDTYGAPVDGTNLPGATTTDSTQYLVTTMISMARASGKPVSFPEVGGRDVTFANAMVSTLTNRAAVSIEFFTFWDVDDSSGTLSWTNSIDNQATLIAAWKAGFGPSGTVVNNPAIPTDATGTVAKNAQALLNGFGVNTKIDTAGYQAATLSTVENCINYLGGVKVLRDGATSSNDSTWWVQVAQATGAKFIAYVPYGAATAFDTMLNNIGAVPGQYIIAFEGCEEADTGAAIGYAETLADAAAFQQTVYSAGQSYGLPTIQLSVGQGWSANPSSGDYGAFGNLSAYADYGNAHVMPGSSPQNGNLLSNFLNLTQLGTPGKPAVVTEFGWNQVVGAGYSSCSQATAAAYIIEFIFDAFVAGCRWYIWYELLDNLAAESAVSRGLFTDAGAPRASATAIKNLFGMLSDTSANAISFQPGRLNYSLSNFPALSGGSGGNQLLLQKSDGSFWLALWNEQPLNDQSTGADLTVAPINITLSLGTPATSVTVYDPSVSSTVVQSGTNVSTMTISLPARVILVKIVK